MHRSWLDRILGTAFVLLVSAWAISHAVHLVLGVVPALIGIAVALGGGVLGWRIYQARRSGW